MAIEQFHGQIASDSLSITARSDESSGSPLVKTASHLDGSVNTIEPLVCMRIHAGP